MKIRLSGVLAVNERQTQIEIAAYSIAWRHGFRRGWRQRRYWLWGRGGRQVGQVQVFGLMLEWRFNRK